MCRISQLDFPSAGLQRDVLSNNMYVGVVVDPKGTLRSRILPRDRFREEDEEFVPKGKLISVSDIAKSDKLQREALVILQLHAECGLSLSFMSSDSQVRVLCSYMHRK